MSVVSLCKDNHQLESPLITGPSYTEVATTLNSRVDLPAFFSCIYIYFSDAVQTYYVPGTVLTAFQILSHLYLLTPGK